MLHRSNMTSAGDGANLFFKRSFLRMMYGNIFRHRLFCRYKDGDEIKPSEKVKMEIVNETTCRLTIPSAKVDDTAEFKVIF